MSGFKMKTKHYLFASLALSFFTIVIACQAQDSPQVDSVLIEKMYNDPLAVRSRAAHQRNADLILYGKVDLEALSPIMTKAGGSCELLMEDISHIRGATEYVQDICEIITVRASLVEKYPEYFSLDRKQRSHITLPKYKSLSEQEIDQLIEIRKSPDR